MSSFNVPAPESTLGIETLMAEYALHEDTWDDNLAMFFAVAHTLFHRTAEEIPAEWGYRHPDIDDSEWWQDDYCTEIVAGWHETEQVTDEDLINFGWFLHKVDEDFRSRGEGGY